MLGRILAALAAMALLSSANAQQARRAEQAFDAQVLHPPVIAPGPDGPRLVYELHLTNFARSTLTLARLDVTDGEGGSLLATYDGAALDAILGRAGAAVQRESPRAVAPGARAIVYVNLLLNGARRPAAVGHEVAFQRTTEGSKIDGAMRIPDTRVDARDLPVLGPPLRGGPWVAVYHPGWERGHRRVFYAVDGRARLPGRFAIDWMRAGGGDGRGAEALAVADGTVVAVRDDFGGDGGDPPATLENETGNYVAIRIGGGRYAFYEHLAPGVRVRVGQRVRRGEAIGSLGATGHVTEPHLHFHLADANAPLAAESLPYVLRYTPLGAYDTIEAFRAGESWNPHAGSIATPSFPSPMIVVAFPE